MFLATGIVFGLPVLTTANWGAGCNGNPYGTYNWPTPTGGYTQTLVQANVTTGAVFERVHAYSPPSPSNIQQASYLMVGPKSGTPSGCYTPSATKTGLFVTYTWQITVNPYVSANCSGLGSSATASLNGTMAANVHIGVSPWYVAPGHSAIQNTVGQITEHCAGGGSFIYSPGPIVLTAAQSTQTFGPWTATSGTSYDFYSSQWINATTNAGEGSQAAALDTTTATLLSVSCGGC